MSIKIAFFVASITALSGCSDHEGAVEALEKAGFDKITTDGYSFFSCAKDDIHATKFRAENPRGMMVEGTVCSGLWAKGSTIRY